MTEGLWFVVGFLNGACIVGIAICCSILMRSLGEKNQKNEYGIKDNGINRSKKKIGAAFFFLE